MRKRTLRSLLLAGALTAGMLVTGLSAVLVSGRTLPETDPGWYVTFTSQGKMNSNFSTSKLDEVIPMMQPGDEAVFKITVKNENNRTTDWYLENKVLQSMEDNSAASGGAYQYRLTYKDNRTGTTTTYYDSTTVGGEETSPAGQGLHEATNALADWLYMDKLSTGQGGVVELTILLDGETQGNSYQTQQADLSLNFAVEMEPTSGGTTTQNKTTTVVKTGDDTPIALYLTLTGAAGAILLALSIVAIKLRKLEAVSAKREAARREEDRKRKGGY